MRQLVALVLCLLSGSGAFAEEQDFPGYHSRVKFYSTVVPSPKTELWTATFREREVEFDLEARSGVKSFCIGEPFLNTPGNHGFAVHARNGNDKNDHWFYMPKATKQEENEWCFAAQHSYRFTVWLVPQAKSAMPKYAVNFEIEQKWGYVTDLKQGSPDFKRRGQPCVAKYCSDIVGALK